MFAIELSGVRPDVYVLGRGWAAGFPFGACVTGSSSLRWKHASGGNPTGCALAFEVIRMLESGLLEQGRKLAAYLDQQFEKLNSKRLTPVLWGVGLVRTMVLGTVPIRGQSPLGPAEGFVQQCRERGLLLHVLSPQTVAVRPPLVCTEQEIEFAAGVIEQVLAEFDKRTGFLGTVPVRGQSPKA
jgi:acetylornithine/succinyldiaminopimelate/putrescine aminotransferase